MPAPRKARWTGRHTHTSAYNTNMVGGFTPINHFFVHYSGREFHMLANLASSTLLVWISLLGVRLWCAAEHAGGDEDEAPGRQGLTL